MIKRLFFNKNFSTLELFYFHVLINVHADANCVQAETELHHTVAVRGKMASITLKTQLCKPALKASAPPPPPTSHELIL